MSESNARGSLPPKLYFRIGEVASLVGVEPHVLRYWEREFRSIRPTKSAKGQRVYSRKDVENLLRVRDLLYRDGFTIAGAKKRLQTRALLNVGDVGTDVGSEHEEAASDHEQEREEEDAALAVEEPQSGPRSHGTPNAPTNATVRVKLTALRAEIEGFLDELETERDERV